MPTGALQATPDSQPTCKPRALVQERHQNWTERFGPLGLSVVELSGDTDVEAHQLDGADLICTTPEKFGARPPLLL